MYLYIEIGPLSEAPSFLTDEQPLTINKHFKMAFVRWVTHKTKRVGWRGCFWKRRTIILTTMMASARVAVHSRVMQNYFKAPPTPHPRGNVAMAADWTTTPMRESNDWRSALHHSMRLHGHGCWLDSLLYYRWLFVYGAEHCVDRTASDCSIAWWLYCSNVHRFTY